MKTFILTILFLFSAVSFVSAQCEEPRLESTGSVIASKNFEINSKNSNNEHILRVEAAAQNSSWEQKGSEGAVLTIFIDDKYNQDIFLFSGAKNFSYQVILGKFDLGKHTLKAVLNRERSAENIGKVSISKLNIMQYFPNSLEDETAISNSPMLYARPDTIDRFSDIPLLTYYEILPNGENSYKIRYTTIFTNEDGGTQTMALMARWGRTTDIEWVLEIEVKNGLIKSEIYQGVNHVAKTFAKNRILSKHPVIFDASVNNNFSDVGCSKLRTALMPIRADLSKKSREVVMDENPWTYRIMAQELKREGRINPQQMGINTIDDLRNYIYVEVVSENNSTAVATEIETSDGKTSRSDFDDPKLRIDRNGYKRIAVRLPSINLPVKSVSLVCQNIINSSLVGTCMNTAILKFIRLDNNYGVLETINPTISFKSLKSGERLTWIVKSDLR